MENVVMSPDKPTKRHRDCSKDTREHNTEEQYSPEHEPAVERGERIATGKAIARGGRQAGFVPGAQAESERQ